MQGLWVLGILGRPGEPQGVVQLGCVMTGEAVPALGQAVPQLSPHGVSEAPWEPLDSLYPPCYSRWKKVLEGGIWTNSFTSLAWDLDGCGQVRFLERGNSCQPVEILCQDCATAGETGSPCGPAGPSGCKASGGGPEAWASPGLCSHLPAVFGFREATVNRSTLVGALSELI